jgi:hypothetical protein
MGLKGLSGLALSGLSTNNTSTPGPFITTWKTDNLSAGSSTATQVTLPLVAGRTYNCTVDWGDGTTEIGRAHV